MSFKIAWEFPKNQNGARLRFDEKLQIDEDTRVTVITELAEAGINDGAVFPPHFISFVDTTINLMKWEHYKWVDIRPVVEEILKKYFPSVEITHP